MAEHAIIQSAYQGQEIDHSIHHQKLENARMRLFRAYDYFKRESQEVMDDLKEPLLALRAVKGDVATNLDMIQADFETGLKNNLLAIWNNWRAADSVMEGLGLIAREQGRWQKQRTASATAEAELEAVHE